MGKEINLKHSSWLIKKIVPIKQNDVDCKIVAVISDGFNVSRSTNRVCLKTRAYMNFFYNFLRFILPCLVWKKNISCFGQDANEMSDQIIKNLEAHELNGSTRIDILFNEHISVESIGKSVDFFLMTHPWWWIEHEPYKWRNFHSDSRILLRKFSPDFFPVFEQLVQSQYPNNCTDSLFYASLTYGFDSFGNYFYNYASHKNGNRVNIFTPYMYGAGVIFLDDDTCTHKHNRFECAFLRATNCTYPELLSKANAST